MSKFFYSHPRGTNKLVTVNDVIDQIPAFNLLFELSPNGSVSNCSGSEVGAQWRKAIREGVIQDVGRPIEIDFFEKIAGGLTTDIDATSLYIKSNVDIDLNIYAQASVQGSGPGVATTFTMARALHAGDGKFSNVSPGGNIYIVDDEQWATISAVDDTTPYAHQVTVKPFNEDYTVNIRAGRNLLFNPTRLVGATSCPMPSVQWMSAGFIRGVQGFRMRGDWKIKIELDRAYQEVMQFAIIFDKKGLEIDSFEFKAMQDMRWNMRLQKNLWMFAGQKITNADLITNMVDEKFPGFEGYEQTLKYGGGFVYQYAKSQGFSLEADAESIMIRQDARKKSMEYFILDGYPFRLAMQRRSAVNFGAYTGACTFSAFDRSGMDKDEITKYGVKSYDYAGLTLHFKNMDSLSDQRVLGSGDYPYKAFMMPADNLTDSKGRSVPPIEFYKPRGYVYEEYVRDDRKIDGCEYMEGHSVDVCMMAVHDPANHIMLTPRNY